MNDRPGKFEHVIEYTAISIFVEVIGTLKEILWCGSLLEKNVEAKCSVEKMLWGRGTKVFEEKELPGFRVQR